jgi:hypothetical protein
MGENMSDHMDDLDDWVRVDCHASDEIRTVAKCVTSSLTDLHGEYGFLPTVYTEWGLTDGEPILRDYRYPGTGIPCAHYERNGWTDEHS